MRARKRFVLGITGGIATGKSVVLAELVRLGAAGISADDLAHKCLLPNRLAYKRIVAHFGRQILDSSGRVNRRKLGSIVFAEPKERRWLECQVHPSVIQALKSFIRSKTGLLAVDIPLLYEAKLESLVDKVLVVWSKEADQVSRLVKRNRFTRDEARQRIRAQMPLSRKRKKADYVLENVSSLSSLRQKTRALYKTLRFFLDNK
jgi:dephospho-CoA kinase